jgi:hypothetical protein
MQTAVDALPKSSWTRNLNMPEAVTNDQFRLVHLLVRAAAMLLNPTEGSGRHTVQRAFLCPVLTILQ